MALVFHNEGMAETATQARFVAALCARIKRLRDEKDWTQEQMATALGIPTERYRKYEKRSALPHHLIERLALITGRDIAYILTGTAAKISAPPPFTGRTTKRA